MTLAAPATHQLQTYDDARAWYGPAMAARTDWKYSLTPADVAELDRLSLIHISEPTRPY